MITELPDAEICTVLVAENDEGLRAAVATILESDGFATLRAANIPETIAKLATFRPSFVLLDLDMLAEPGHDFIRLRGGDLRLSSIPVIAMTGDPWASVPSGAVGLLQKPFTLDEFLRLVHLETRRWVSTGAAS